MSSKPHSPPKLFTDLPLPESLILTTAELGYAELTPIQAQSLPILLEGKDLIGQAKTGSGKTAAFSLPLLARIDLKQRQVQALVLCPTRELCTQVAGEIRKLGRRLPGLQVIILSGGQPIGPQLASLKRGVHIVVGTPGRVLDHLRRHSLKLEFTSTVVLDEADRMLEMGFQEDMENILSHAPDERQTLLFSATFPSTIEAMSRSYQKNAVRVTVESEAESFDHIQQIVYEVAPDRKFQALLASLRKHRPSSAVVFCNFKVNVVDVATGLSQAGLSVAALHGDLEQWDRDQVMARFRNQSVRILVATDVAARGIDVPNLDAVFNFDLPAQPEIYVHRIGRTGRAGKNGVAVSLCTEREHAKIQSIANLTGTALELEQLSEPSSEAAEQASSPHQSGAMETLRISGGRKDKVRPGDILGALTGEAGGLPAADVGKIEIHDHHSFVAVSAYVARTALARLQSGKIKGRRFRIELVR